MEPLQAFALLMAIALYLIPVSVILVGLIHCVILQFVMVSHQILHWFVQAMELVHHQTVVFVKAHTLGSFV